MADVIIITVESDEKDFELYKDEFMALKSNIAQAEADAAKLERYVLIFSHVPRSREKNNQKKERIKKLIQAKKDLVIAKASLKKFDDEMEKRQMA